MPLKNKAKLLKLVRTEHPNLRLILEAIIDAL